MGKIIDKTSKYYKEGPEGAEYLEYEGSEVPEGVVISKSNVVKTTTGKMKLHPHPSFVRWGWFFKGNFHVDFNSPEEALAHYNKTVEWFKNNKKS